MNEENDVRLKARIGAHYLADYRGVATFNHHMNNDDFS